MYLYVECLGHGEANCCYRVRFRPPRTRTCAAGDGVMYCDAHEHSTRENMARAITRAPTQQLGYLRT